MVFFFIKLNITRCELEIQIEVGHNSWSWLLLYLVAPKGAVLCDACRVQCRTSCSTYRASYRALAISLVN